MIVINIKNLNMKTVLLNLTLVLLGFICNAQRTISLEEWDMYLNTEEGIPEDVSYIKDTKNQLNPFVGIWKGSYNGKTFEFKFEKKIKSGEDAIKLDRIMGEVIITENRNNFLFNRSHREVHSLSGLNFQRNTYMLHFSVKPECNDSGYVYIEIRKNNSKKMTLYFSRDTGWYDPKKCPNYSTYKVLLPEDKIELTKQ